MYLLNYALYDLYAFFVYLRNHPQRFTQYHEGVRQIAELIDSPFSGTAEANSIRRILRAFYTAEDPFMSFVAVDNVYTAEILFVTNKAYYPLLSAILRELLAHGDDPDRLSALCDALHNIPIILVRHARPRKHIQFEIDHYQKKYHPGFLKDELKAIR